MSTVTTSSRLTAFLRRSETLNLFYLVFLFMPWLFVIPRSIDILVAVVALLIFLPLHYWSYRKGEGNLNLPIAFTALLGVATAPFNVGYSVFHIYAAALSGFQPTRKLSSISMVLITVIFLVSSIYFDCQIYGIGFGVLMSVIVWVLSLSQAQSIADQAQKNREHALDKQQASLDERERIARDLHDLLGHTLTMVALKSDIASRLIDTDPAGAKSEIENIRTSARLALKDVRSALSGLTDTNIEREIANAETALGAAGISLMVTGQYPDLSAQSETMYGLVIREAVTNIIRHSAASSASICFDCDDVGAILKISDNGRGGYVSEGQGLSGIRKRIEAIGGAVAIVSGEGFSITASLPKRVRV